ncbi:MAG TPA: BamA/TamA family outer membrane protein [Bacteroidia bacterium]|nr:BamA/TamA family outer membrane protein [Bacteroidia bacterium]
MIVLRAALKFTRLFYKVKLSQTYRLFLNWSIFILVSVSAPAQTNSNAIADSQCLQRDLPGWLRQKLGKPEKSGVSNNNSLLLVPIIGSNPATGFMIGVGGQFAFRLPENKRYSFLSGSIQATTKQQYLFLLKNTVYTRKEKFFLTGDWRFLIFSQTTYGLGTDAPKNGILSYQYNLLGQETTMDSLAQPMEFNFVRIHQSGGYRVAEGIYLGLGYQLDGFFKIVDQKLKMNPGDTLITAHYAYNLQYGFDTKRYLASGLNVNFIWDTRDNMIQAYKGHFLAINWRGDFTFLGSRKNVTMLNVEWRSFHPFSKRNPAHQIAFWAIGQFTPKGGYPYLILPATAYDQRSRSARGYTQGRFRGNNYVYSEAEYRFPLTGCGGLLGGVLFLNATTCDNPAGDLKLFQSIQPGYGFGLRVMLDKASRSNLCADFGFGKQSAGFYLAVSETF